MRTTTKRSIYALILGGACSIVTVQTQASGFALIEQSASGMGKAFAGMAASAEDASSMFYNPAAVSVLEGQQLTVGGHYVAPSAVFTNNGSVDSSSAALSGGNGGDAGVATIVPNFYYKKDLGDGLHLGFGVSVPFGMSTSYDAGWVGRYHAQLSDLQTVSLSPVVSLKTSEQFSVGASMNIEYANAVLTNRVDFGSKCCGITPQAEDGSVKLKGDDVALGVSFGGLYTLGNTRVGASYRSAVSHKLAGQADFTLTANAASSLGKTTQYTENATASLALPEIASLSVAQQMTESLVVYGDVTWTGWSTFKELAIDFDNAAQPDSNQPENWKNTLRYSVGGAYKVSNSFIIRAGVAYDETPVPDDIHRTPRVPDGNRKWVSVGSGYRFNQMASVDIGYSHLFIEDVGIENKEEFAGSLLKGSYKSAVNIASAQLNMRF